MEDRCESLGAECSKLKNGTLKDNHILHIPIPGTYATLWIKKKRGGSISADMIKLRILRWGDYLGLSVWALNAITSIKKAEREVTNTEEMCRKKFEDAGLEDWRDTALSQGMPAVTRSWKRWRTDSPLGTLAGLQLCCWHLDFSPMKLVSDIWPSEP